MFLSYPPDEKSARFELNQGLAETRQREGLTDVDYATETEKLAQF